MESAEFWLIRGSDLFNQQKYTDALAALNLALKIDPQNTNALVERGAVLGAMEDHI